MLDLASYDNNFDRFMLETKAAGVDAMLCVAVDMITAKKMR